jgi:hypothetical protein
VEGSGRGLIHVLSQNFRGGTEENHEPLSQDSRSSGRDLIADLNTKQAGMLAARPRRSVCERKHMSQLALRSAFVCML